METMLWNWERKFDFMHGGHMWASILAHYRKEFEEDPTMPAELDRPVTRKLTTYFTLTCPWARSKRAGKGKLVKSSRVKAVQSSVPKSPAAGTNEKLI